MATTWLDPASDERVRFVSRKECGLPRSRAPTGAFTRPHAIAHHGVGRGNGLPLRDAMAIWRGYHRYHTQDRGWTDVGYCVDDQTEILTTDGWRTHDQLEGDEVVLTLNPETGLSEWQQLQAVNRFEGSWRMLSMETRVHSSLTTAGHRWFVRDPKASAGTRGVTAPRWRWRTSEELVDGLQVPLAAPCTEPPTEPKHSDDLVELVAWYWTEGHITMSRGNPSGAALTQSHTVNPVYTSRIHGLLTRLFGPASESLRRGDADQVCIRGHAIEGDNVYTRPDGRRQCRECWIKQGNGPLSEVEPDEPSWRYVERRGRTEFHLNAVIAQRLREIAPDRAVSFAFLQQLTEAQLQLFLEASISADGWRRGEHEYISQRRRDRLEPVQFAAQLLGRPTALSYRSDIDMWALTFKSMMTARVMNREWVNHDGTVWCPTTPNGTWLARRDGRPFFTGNSAGWADAPDVGGAVLEGRHWGKDGGHTQNGGNTRGYACAYTGDGREPVADTAWRAWRAWIYDGITAGALSSPPKISGHDDWYPKLCPGSQVKAELHERSQLGRMASEEDELRLTEGSSGKYVGRVQIRLRQFFGTDRIAIDEQYGSQTRDHVAEFQKQKNLLGEGGAEVGVVDWFTYVELIHGAHGEAVDH